MSRGTVLVLRALGLGDLFTGFPALALLRAARPHDRIVLAAPEVFHPVVDSTGLVDDLVHAHELEPISQPPHRPDLAIDLHGNAPASARLLAACEPREVVSYAGGSATWQAGEHEVARWCRLVAEGLRLSAEPPWPSAVGCVPVPPAAAAVSGRTVLHVGAKAPARRWPPERFAEVGRSLAATGHEVVVTGGAAERGLVRAVSRACGAPGTVDLSLLDLLALVAAARLVICGDTGVAHVASNYRTPSVVLFGPVSPAVWGPPPDERHQVLFRGSGAGDPHGDRPDPALLRIGVDDVLAAVPRALAAREEPVPA